MNRTYPYVRPTNLVAGSVEAKLSYVPDANQGALVLKVFPCISATETLIKTLGGRKLTEHQYYFPPLVMYYNQIVRNFDPEIDPSCTRFLSEWGWPLIRPDLLGQGVSSTWDMLYDFQLDAVLFLTCSPLPGALLSLSPGLGKSLVSIASADMMGAKKVLVIAPLSLLGTWKAEVEKWSEYSTEISRGSKPFQGADWVITNYDSLPRNIDKFQQKWDVVIVDESILIKNRKTQRHQSVFRICQQSGGKIWLLSGSPISREVDDLYGQFKTIMPSAFASYWRFVDFYCQVEITPWGNSIVGSKDVDRDEFRDIMHVRHQSEVLTLPEMREEVIEVAMAPVQEKLYSQIMDEFYVMLEDEELPVPTKLAQMTRLMQVVSHPANLPLEDPSVLNAPSGKHSTILELAETGYFELPAIVWVHWVRGAAYLADSLTKAGYSVALVTGSTPADERDELISLYKGGEIDFLILSTTVGKYGLTLTNTKTMIYLDRNFDMDAFIQSLHRVQRIGLEHSPSTIVLKCSNTIDDLVEMNLAGKAISISRISNADLTTLLKQIGVRKPDEM